MRNIVIVFVTALNLRWEKIASVGPTYFDLLSLKRKVFDNIGQAHSLTDEEALHNNDHLT
jgi:hypothetical protein